VSACEHIIRDLETFPDGEELCITYIPGKVERVHNASCLGASLLARTFSYTRNETYRELARKAIGYTAKYQRPDGSCITAKKRICTGLTTFIQPTFWIPSSITRRAQATVSSTEP